MAKYRVLVDDLTVNKDGAEITDLFGNVIGYQTTSEIYPKGTVLDEEDVAESLREAVDAGETEGYLEKVGDGAADDADPVEPFPGYSDMSVEEVQTLFTFVPSETIRAIVEFEAEHGENRAGIADYHIGRGEAFTDRLTGRAGSPQQDADEKENLASIVTREVTEDDVRFGESPLDDGTPQREVGSLEGDDRPEGEKAKASGDGDGEASKADDRSASRGRRGRRSSARAAQSADAGGKAQPEGDKGDGDDGDKS